MGGLPETFGKAATEAFEKFAPEIAQSAGKAAQKYLPAGASTHLIPKIAGVYEDTANSLSKVTSLEDQLTGKSGAALLDKLRLQQQRTDFHLGEMHKNPQNYPLRKPLDQHTTGEKYNIAHNEAYNEVLGSRGQMLAGHIDAIRQEHNQILPSYGEVKARNITDALGTYFKEQVDKRGGMGVADPRGRTAYNLSQHPLTRDIGFRPSPYKAPGPIESGVKQYSSMIYASLAGVEHILTTPFNAMLSQNLTNFAKALPTLLGPQENVRQALYALGTMGEVQAMETSQMANFHHGIISKFVPGSVGQILHENLPIAGMDWGKKRNAAFFGQLGRYNAADIKANILSGDATRVKRGMIDAQYHGMDGPGILRRGNITLQDLQAAVFHTTNNNMFLNSGLRRARAWTSGPVGRTFGIFHTYGMGIHRLFMKSLMQSIKKGDLVGVARTLAVAGIVFPAVGDTMDMVKHIVRGHSPGEEFDEWKRREKENVSLSGINTAQGWIDRLDGMVNMLTLGVMGGFISNMSKYDRAESLAGPIVSVPIDIGRDAIHYFKYKGKDKDKGPYDVKSWWPLAREALHDSLIPLSGMISRYYLPPASELKKEKPMTTKRQKAIRAAERGKARKSGEGRY